MDALLSSHDMTRSNGNNVNQHHTFQHIDIEYMAAVCPGNPSYITAMLECFRKGSANHLQSLHSYLDAEDYDALRKTAHMIKPIGAYIGANEFTDIAKVLEQAAISKNHFQITLELGKLETVVNNIVREINTYLVH